MSNASAPPPRERTRRAATLHFEVTSVRLRRDGPQWISMLVKMSVSPMPVRVMAVSRRSIHTGYTAAELAATPE